MKKLSYRTRVAGLPIEHEPLPIMQGNEPLLNYIPLYKYWRGMRQKIYELYRTETILSRLLPKFERGVLSDREYLAYHRALTTFASVVSALIPEWLETVENMIDSDIRSLVRIVEARERGKGYPPQPISQSGEVRVRRIAKEFKETGDPNVIRRELSLTPEEWELIGTKIPIEVPTTEEVIARIDTDTRRELALLEELYPAYKALRDCRTTKEKLVALQWVFMITHQSGLIAERELGPGGVEFYDWLSNIPPEQVDKWMKYASVKFLSKRQPK